MAEYTENLRLFKWNTNIPSDLDSTFNIDAALNGNWDKLDEEAGRNKEDIENLETNKANTEDVYSKSEANELLENKVEKEEGKGLSSNDYTTTEKNKLNGIESGAQVNVLEGVTLGGQNITINNKKVEIKDPEITNARQSTIKDKTFANIDARIEELEADVDKIETTRGHVYGIRRKITSNSSSAWERLFDSVGKVASATKNGGQVANDFDNCYPWSDIRRCNVDPATGQVLAYYGETGYAADGSNGEVMVKIPEFWWKRERVPDEFGNVYEYIYIADYARAGYKKSEEFFVGAYLLSTTDEEGTIVAHSKSGVVPRYNTTLANFRNYAKNTGDGFCLLDYHYFLLQMLYLVEYAHFNSQNMLGNGITQYSTGTSLLAENNTNRIVISSAGTGLWVGKTVGIGTQAGNFSVAEYREITSIEDYNDGQISGKAIHFDGDAVNIAVGNVIFGCAQKTGENDVLGNSSGCINNNGYHPVNYRGIENIFGNLWQHIDGLNIKDYVAYICKDPDEYTDDKFTSPYEQIGYTNSDVTDSYIKKLGLDEKHPEVALPIECAGSSSTGACDNYWSSAGNRIAYVGGNFSNYGTRDGFFAWSCSSASSSSHWRCGARLLKYQ